MPFKRECRLRDAMRFPPPHHRKSALSTEAHARPMSGSTPQKQTLWRVLYRSSTTAGSSLVLIDVISAGHCESADVGERVAGVRKKKEEGGGWRWLLRFS